MKIAVMPGDGVGKEVVPEGLKVLNVVSKKFGFSYSTTPYPFGGEYYLEKKITLPDSALKELAHEFADCLWLLLRLAEVCAVDLASSLEEKVTLAAEKYPVEKAYGRADKYTEYRES